ncbi:MAG: pantoate--beta-alanine ligase [Parabacteroides sp.]|nr:pantoate--beta-alanine ligase [Parabacteroides sp.]
MKNLQTISEMKEYVRFEKSRQRTIGFVPTMGYLHDGHLSLIKRSKEENDVTVLSIFLNPTQFAPNEDLSKYPRDFEKDSRLALESGVDALFYPKAEELYPNNYQTYINVEALSRHLCGKSRPDHFRGVATIVSKLFNIVSPDHAYFGQKDAQQYFIIDRMAKDLNHDVNVVMCPIVREKDGLAMSSRNVYLDPQERQQALCLYRSLEKAEEAITAGERNAQKVKAIIKESIDQNPLAAIDYIETVRTETLEPVDEIEGPTLIALAVKFGKTRLLDNTIVRI